MNPSAARIAARVLEALGRGERIYTAVVTGARDPALIGRRWWLSGRRHGGTLGSPALDEAVAAEVPALFPPRESRGALSRDFRYFDGGQAATATVYIELHGPPARMIIVGAGHIAIPLSRMGAMLGMRVEVLDDRPDFAAAARFPEAEEVRVIDFRDPFTDFDLGPSDHVVLVTRGHSFDYECLVRLLRMPAPPGYIGMIGSRRRVRATHEQLAREGFTTDEMRRVRAPVGLDLGGQTPAEIAVSVVAEIILFHAGGTGVPLVEKERVVERFFGDL
ncbi:MAG: XdhC family protein [Gemmatimonadota bacterium]|nr:XdhC family protein [Gemmatimonadota bacterium]